MILLIMLVGVGVVKLSVGIGVCCYSGLCFRFVVVCAGLVRAVGVCVFLVAGAVAATFFMRLNKNTIVVFVLDFNLSILVGDRK